MNVRSGTFTQLPMFVLCFGFDLLVFEDFMADMTTVVFVALRS